MGNPVLSGNLGLGWYISHLSGQQRPDDLDASRRPHLYPHAASAGLRPFLQDLQWLRGRFGLHVRHAAAGALRRAAPRNTAYYPIPRMQDGKWRLRPTLPNQDHLHAVHRGVCPPVLVFSITSLQPRPDSRETGCF